MSFLLLLTGLKNGVYVSRLMIYKFFKKPVAEAHAVIQAVLAIDPQGKITGSSRKMAASLSASPGQA